MTAAQTSEEAAAGASYVITFYRNVMALTHWHSVFRNILAETKMKYGSEGVGKLEEDEKSQYLETAGQVRYFVDQCFVMYSAIVENTNLSDAEKKSGETIEAIMERIDEGNDYAPAQKDLKNFLVEMHKFLLKDVIKGLLKSGQDFISDVFNTEAKKA